MANSHTASCSKNCFTLAEGGGTEEHPVGIDCNYVILISLNRTLTLLFKSQRDMFALASECIGKGWIHAATNIQTCYIYS